MFKALTISLWVLFAVVIAEGAVPFADLRAEDGVSAGSEPVLLATLGEVLLVSASDSAHGQELWRVDATTGQASLVRDIYPGPGSSAPRSAVVFNNRAYFRALDGPNGSELWETDGTAAGTRLVADVLPGGSSGVQATLTAVEDGFFFSGRDDFSNFYALWFSDGTAAGTRLVRRHQSDGDLTFFELDTAVSGDRLAYSTYDFTSGFANQSKLYVSDGTTQGTVEADAFECCTEEISAVDGQFVYFAYRNGFGGLYALPDTGGVPTEILPLFFEPQTVTVNDTLLLVGEDNTGWNVWRTDGTQAGTVKLFNSTTSSINLLIQNSDQAFFSVTDIASPTIWRTDGTAAGTEPWLAEDAFPPGASFAVPLAYADGQLLFTLSLSAFERQIWRSDGTVPGTMALTSPLDGSTLDLSTVRDGFAVATGAQFAFRADDARGGLELWLAAANGASTAQKVDINRRTGSRPTSLSVAGGELNFLADDGVSGRELWRRPGITAQAERLTDIVPLQPDTFSSGLSTPRIQLPQGKGDVQFFFLHSAPDSAAPLTLGAIPAVGAAPVFLGNIDTNPPVDKPTATTADGILLFRNFSSEFGSEIWRSDGTLEGTQVLVDINPGADSSSPFSLTESNGVAWFTARQSNNDVNPTLWRTDGTAAGTVAVYPFADGEQLQFEGPFATLGNTTYFSARAAGTDRYNYELWSTDGTAEGTGLLADIEPTAGSYPREMVSTAQRMFFRARTLAAGTELWSVNAQQEVTMVKDINPGPATSTVQKTVAVDDRVFFAADDGVHGLELWVSDGTPAGTQMVRDVVPGQAASAPAELIALDNAVIFSAATSTHGREPWISDGTAAGTFRLIDVAPGPASSSPESFTVVDGALHFVADDGTTGAELWRIASLDDFDGDGLANADDNCTVAANPDQTDADADGYGNACDADFDNNGVVNAADLGYLRTVFFTADAVADLNGDGAVNVLDLARLRQLFFEPPGPSGLQ